MGKNKESSNLLYFVTRGEMSISYDKAEVVTYKCSHMNVLTYLREVWPSFECRGKVYHRDEDTSY